MISRFTITHDAKEEFTLTYKHQPFCSAEDAIETAKACAKDFMSTYSPFGKITKFTSIICYTKRGKEIPKYKVTITKTRTIVKQL